MDSTIFVSDLFQSYEQDVVSFIRTFGQRDARFLTMSRVEKESFLSFLEKGFPSAERSFQQLNSEFKTLPTTVKTKLEGKIKDYKQKLAKIGERTKEVRTDVETCKMKEDQEMTKDTFKSSINRIGDSLVNSNDRLKDIKRMAHDSDEMTAAINSRLLGDRENLLSVKKLNETIQGHLNTANTMISSIRHKQDHEKLMLIVIILLLVLLNVGVFVFKVFT